jgi:hypothetical protein
MKPTLLEWLFRVCVLLIVFITPFCYWAVDFGSTCMAMGIPVVLDFRPLFYAEVPGSAWLNFGYALGIGVVLACAIIMLLIFEYYERLVEG